MFYFMKRSANKVGSVFSKPGAFIYRKAAKLAESDVLEMILTTLMSFLIITAALFEIFPFESILHTIIIIVVALFLISLSIGLINALIPLLLGAICKLTAPFAYLNNHCNRNLDKDLEGEPRYTTSTGVGVGPKAEVGIKYFIEMEKKNKHKGFYKAKYVSK